MTGFAEGLLKIVGLTAGGIGAAGMGVALATNETLLGIIMFIIFVVGSLFIEYAAEIAAAVFAVESFMFWVSAGVESISKGDSIFALVLFIVSIVIMVIRRSD